MLLKRIELLLDPRIEEIAIAFRYDDDKVDLTKSLWVSDGLRVEIYDGVKVSMRTLED